VMTDDAGVAWIQQNYTLTGVQREVSGVLARFVAEEVNVPHAERREPTLEDAYVWIMGGAANVGAA